MRITFLGTGGGRWVVLRQLRASGGFVLELAGEKLHIDPGPGSLVRAKEYRMNLCDLTGILVSHRHQDHMNDVSVVIESMTKGATKKRGTFASTRGVIKGDSEHPPLLDKFHTDVLERIILMEPGESIKMGNVRITATPTRHREVEGVGFVFEGEGLKVGYTGDGEYYPGMEKSFMDCDYLIINVLRPRTEKWPGHMDSFGAKDLVSRAKPRNAIMQHLGMKMLRGVAQNDAAWITGETGVKTIVASDGMVIKRGSAGKRRTVGLESFMQD
jgi:phosphoribosyl 1,2-cyclic phosphodiesterase